MNLTLPWPDRRLSPNARGHWRVKEDPRKAAKQMGFIACLTAKVVSDPLPDRLQLTAIFHPPTNGRYDLDNALARLKPALDGIFLALQRDDADVCRVVLERGKPIKHGSVTIILGEVQL